jgi:hypothetical protein
MTSPAGSPCRLLIVLDREYGERLRAVWPGTPVWIELSPINEPVVRELWNENLEPNHLTGITGLKFQPATSTEDRFVAELGTIDLHHGVYSTNAPYTELEVIGCMLSNRVQSALADIGFTEFQEQGRSFLARRTPEQAAVRR